MVRPDVQSLRPFSVENRLAGIAVHCKPALAARARLWQQAAMSAFPTIDLMARGGSVALFLLWSWVLWRDLRHALAARLAIALNGTIICYVLSALMWEKAPVTLASLLVDGASVLAPAFFWLFAHVWFSDSKAVGRRRWLLVGLFALLPAVQIVSILATGRFVWLVWVLVRIGMVAFAAAGLWIGWRGREDDLVEPRRKVRSALVWIIGLFVLWVNLIEMLPFRHAWSLPLRSGTEVAILLSTLFVSARLYGFSNPDLFVGVPARPVDGPEDAASDPLAPRLLAHMETERPYRDETLTIAGLAGQMGMQEYQLRRLINGTLGHRNFAAFLNGYRLAEVKAALADPAQKDVPILTIALDAGFGSLGPFNRAFRDAEGMTPTLYRLQEIGLTQSRKAAKEGA